MQGESEYASGNKSLGFFKLSGLRPAPRGETKVNVTFDLDANGILSVKAIDETTGVEQTITISNASRLETTEINQMTKDAAEYIDTPSHITEPSSPLVGSNLLCKIKEYGDVSKIKLAQKCGYVRKNSDGSESILLKEFYEEFVSASRREINDIQAVSDHDLLLTPEEEKLANDEISYPRINSANNESEMDSAINEWFDKIFLKLLYMRQELFDQQLSGSESPAVNIIFI